MSEQETTALNYRTAYKKRKTVLDDYINIIYKMLYDKIDPANILGYIIRAGYAGNITTLRNKIQRVARNNFNFKVNVNWGYKFVYPKDILIVKRSELLKYITTKNPKTKRNENTVKCIDIIRQKYKTVGVLENIYNDFHEIIMGKDTALLENFIVKYESSIVESFISGLKDDIVSVNNAISSELSSGFVEGNNNKFKVRPDRV